MLGISWLLGPPILYGPCQACIWRKQPRPFCCIPTCAEEGIVLPGNFWQVTLKRPSQTLVIVCSLTTIAGVADTP